MAREMNPVEQQSSAIYVNIDESISQGDSHAVFKEHKTQALGDQLFMLKGSQTHVDHKTRTPANSTSMFMESYEQLETKPQALGSLTHTHFHDRQSYDGSLSCTIDNTVHSCVPSDNYRTTNCLYCKQMNVRTKAGWNVTTRHRCNVCKVPLCGKRGCFTMFHKYMLNS